MLASHIDLCKGDNGNEVKKHQVAHHHYKDADRYINN